MARKPLPVATTTPVRWTDEEWKTIADRILDMRGLADAPAGDDAAEIKAKDVFLAQDVLPEARQRKLISIQQGFDASRQRLLALMAATPAAAEGKASGAKARKKPGGSLAGADEQDVAAKAAPKTKGRAAAEHKDGAPAPTDAAGAEPSPVESMQDEISQDPPVALPTAAAGADAHSAPVGAAAQPSEQTASMPDLSAPPSRPAPSHARAAGRDHKHAHAEAAAPRSLAAEAPAQTDLVELARPFVAMVCQEFANALVKAFKENAGAEALVGGLGAASFSGAAAGRKQPQGRDKPGASYKTDGNNARAPSPAVAAYAAPDMDESDEQLSETDVQPLFDPKLPPTANSSFRPKIALVAAHSADLEDLKQGFPELDLIPVTLDELRSNPVLGTCQRIVGLREDVPAAADEHLRRTFGKRYFRAHGGINKVREQLRSWLSNPSSNTGDGNRAGRQGNAKGSGPKKRQFRRPRV